MDKAQQQMLLCMELRGFGKNTISSYSRGVRQFKIIFLVLHLKSELPISNSTGITCAIRLVIHGHRLISMSAPSDFRTMLRSGRKPSSSIFLFINTAKNCRLF